ncbi:MAG: homoserine O-acetyltransferase [Dehalococcoidales bacterium]|nr:homoserine O-acetyltransferase [Dehalococcoidales bacterium]
METTNEGNAGIISTQYFTFAQPPDEMKLENGETLGPVTLAYETYGNLNKERSNAILIVHALSGDAHVAGINRENGDPGWWNTMVGPGKAFDTGKYFVVCSNVIGGCRGSTGPSSINPKTGRNYGLNFPLITIGDMVNAQKRLIDYLGIKKLLTVAGGSMGGMQVLQWMVSYPEMIRSAMPIAITLKHSPQQIAFNEVGRQAIIADPNWKQGDYYGGPPPVTGLALARMVGHITYMSDQSMEEKFGRRFRSERVKNKFAQDFEVEGYLQNRGTHFVKRFDANSYLYVTKAMDFFDASNGKPLAETFKGLKAKVMVIAFKSDWLYPAYQSREIVRACKMAGLEVTYCEVDSTYGHDAFLLETEELTHLIGYFLEKLFRGEVTAEYEI